MVLNFSTLRIYLLVAGVPFALAVIHGTLFVYDRYMALNEAVYTQELIKAANESRELAHELNIENLEGAAYIVTGDPAYLESTQNQARLVSERLEELTGIWAGRDYDPELRQVLASLTEKIEALPEIRRRVAQPGADVSEIKAALNDIYNQTENILFLTNGSDNDSDQRDLISALRALERMKSFATLNLSILQWASDNRFMDYDQYANYVRAAAQEDAYLEDFSQIPGDMITTQMFQMQASPVRGTMISIRDALQKGDTIDMSVEEVRKLGVRWVRLLRNSEKNLFTKLTEHVAATKAQASIALWGSAIASTAAVLIFAVFAFSLVRKQEEITSAIVSASQRMIDGDLDTKLPKAGANHLSDIIRSLAVFRDNTRISRDEAAERQRKEQQVTQRLQIQNEEHTARTGRIAEDLERTAQTTEELANSVTNTLNTTELANTFAGEMSTKAAEGKEIVNDAIDAMSRIQAASDKITSIIRIIDEIAFQTNLLALNARVEAARAGHVGRGFAVVATEVQQLASRSAKSAGDISGLIEEAAVEVEKGVKIVEKSGSALEEINYGAGEIASLIQTMTDMSRQQAKALNDISAATARLDDEMSGFEQLEDDFDMVAANADSEPLNAERDVG